jgi:hypothetical protein
MTKHLTLDNVVEEVLHDLIECYFSGEDYFMSNRLGHIFKDDEEAALFITNEGIINAIKKQLKGKYYLQDSKVQRVFKSQVTQLGDFHFEDIKLEIRINEDDD